MNLIIDHLIRILNSLIINMKKLKKNNETIENINLTNDMCMINKNESFNENIQLSRFYINKILKKHECRCIICEFEIVKNQLKKVMIKMKKKT